MLTCLAFELANLNRLLFYETSLVHISYQINNVLNKKRFNREPYNKNVSGSEAVYYNEKTLFCLLSKKVFLNSDTMNVTYVFQNITSTRFLII